MKNPKALLVTTIGIVASLLPLTMAQAANPTKAEISKTISSTATTLTKAISDLAKKNGEAVPSETTYQTIFGSIPMPSGIMLNPKAHSLTDMFNYKVVAYICNEGIIQTPCAVGATQSNSKASVSSNTKTSPNNTSSNNKTPVNANSSNQPSGNANSSNQPSGNVNSSVTTPADPNLGSNSEPATPAVVVIPKIFKTLTYKQNLNTLSINWSYLGKTPKTVTISYYPLGKLKLAKSSKISGSNKTFLVSNLISNTQYQFTVKANTGLSKTITAKLIAKPAAAQSFSSTKIGDTLLLTWLPDYSYIESSKVGSPSSLLLTLRYINPISKPLSLKLDSNITSYTLKSSQILGLDSISLAYQNLAGLSEVKTIRIDKTYLDKITPTQDSLNSLTLTWPLNDAILDATLTISGNNLLRNTEVIKLTKNDTKIQLSNLTPKGNYSFAIKQNYADGSSDYLKLNSFTLLENPLTPTNLAVTPNNAWASINWAAVNPSSGADYILDYKLSTSSTWTSVTTTSPNYSLVGLTNNQSYQIRVASHNSFATSTYSNILSFTPINIPNSPTSLSVVGNDTTAKLSWTAPSPVVSSVITSYLVEYKISTNPTYTQIYTNSLNTTYLLTGLTNEVSYDLRVSAIIVYGNSLPSEKQTVKPTASLYYIIPQPAINTSQGILLNWTPSLALLASNQLLSYRVDYQLQGASTWDTLTISVNQTPSYTLTNLVAGMTYNYKVTPIMGEGFTDSLAPIVVLSFVATNYSSNIYNLNGYATANGAQLYWSQIPGLNTTYSVFYQATGATSWVLLASGLTATTYSATSLSASTSYNFQVTSSNGTTLPPLTITPTQSSLLPSTPAGLIAQGSISAGNTVTLLWGTPTYVGGSSITSYLVEYKLSTVATWSIFSSGSINTYATITGLTAGSSYDFRVTPYNSYGAGAAATAAATPFAAPTGASSVGSLNAAPSAGSVLLSWIPPTSVGTANVINYYIYQKLTSAVDWVLLSSTQVAPAYTISNLTPGTSYDFKVQANNGLVLGSPAVITASPFNLPSAPTNLLVTKATATPSSVTLTWGNPSSNGGSLVTSYQIQQKLSSSSTWVTVASNNLTNTFLATSLLTNSSYDFSITPINAAGYGSPAYVTVTTYSLPSAPTNLLATSSYYTLSLSWLTPSFDGNTPILGYQISYKQSTDLNYTQTSCPAFCSQVNNYLLNLPLLPNTSYDIQVAAINAVGNSLPLTQTFSTLSPVAPSLVLNAIATTGLNTVNLSWSTPSSDNGSPILSYTVSVSPSGLNTYVVLYTGSNLSAIDSSTTTGLSYDYKIVATNAIGDSLPVIVTIVSN